ncbi:MAG: hypothetical protein CMJ20_07110 [Phycisphaeraceae bacterium]|nr:hypothetical protein [Phycisphaeraceae bacterium]|tara:strand:- start:1103 stop:2680 length:1578 start_codon:yes stop_codon:yes gene_type:complete
MKLLCYPATILAAVVLMVVQVGGCGESTPQPPNLHVACAASMANVLARIEPAVQSDLGLGFTVDAASSGALAQQIIHGSDVDIFVSADHDWMEVLDRRGMLLTGSQRDLVGNRLVVITRDGATNRVRQLSDLVDSSHQPLAVGQPDSVPLGKYTQQALIHAGIWQRVGSHVAMGPDATAVLRYVASGQSPVGIVYQSDALRIPNLQTILQIDQSGHSPIRYTAAVVRTSRQLQYAEELVDWLASDRAAVAYRASGLEVLGRQPAKLASRIAFNNASVNTWPESATVMSAVALSVLSAFAAVAVCLLPGIGIAWLLARKQFFGKAFVEIVVMLPMVVPPVVTGYVLLVLFSIHGPIGSPIFQWLSLRIAFTWFGAALAQAVIAFPLLVLTLRVAIESVDRELEQAATSMGASAWRVLTHVTLPISWPGLAAGCVLAFARSLGEFGATVLIAGNIPGRTQTLPLAIYSFSHMPEGQSTTVGLALVAIALAVGVLLLSRWFSSQFIASVASTQFPRIPRRSSGKSVSQ